MTRQVKIIVEKHADGYVAYPLGLKAWWWAKQQLRRSPCRCQSAIRFHIETFGARDDLMRAYEQS